MGNPRAKRDKVSVKAFTDAPFQYGFLTNTVAADRTALGQAVVTNASTNVVFGANSPKPGRASKGGTNSYYDITKASTLSTAGWKLTSPFRRLSGDTTNSKVVWVKLGLVKYCWRMPVATYSALGGAKATLKINDFTAADANEAVFGTSFPRPGRAKKTLTIGTGQNQKLETYSTFCGDDIDFAAMDGWALIKASKENLN